MKRSSSSQAELNPTGTTSKEGYNPNMESDCAEILARAIRLPKEARAALADSLLETLDTEVDENAGEAWRLEISRRLAEIDAKAVDLIPWPDARTRLEARLKG